MSSIITGAYDLHVHAAPDVLPRKFDEFEMAQRAIDTGMAGFAIKSHYFCTAERAQNVNKLYPGTKAFGMLWLNQSCGGINPYAVELAGRAGCKYVGFPTVDTYNSITKVFTLPPEKRGFWASIIVDMKNDGITLKAVEVSKDGKLLPETYDCLDIIAKYDMAVATGHLSVEDCLLVVKAAKERGVKRIICTHVSSAASGYDTSYQKEMQKMGAIMEHTMGGVWSGKIPFEKMAGQMRELGPDNCLLATDFGQPKNGYPDEGLLWMSERLIKEAGFTEDEVRKMIVDNPKFLMNDYE